MTTRKSGSGRPRKTRPAELPPLAQRIAVTETYSEPAPEPEEPETPPSFDTDLSRFERVPLAQGSVAISEFLPSGMRTRGGEHGQEVDIDGVTHIVYGFVERADKPGRVARAKAAGWRHLSTEQGSWGTPTANTGQAEPSAVLNRPGGGGDVIYPMVKPKEWVVEDFKAADKKADAVEQEIWKRYKGKQNPYKDQSSISTGFFTNEPNFEK